MHVLVATDGKLDTELTADFASALAGQDGKVTVMMVVEIPRRFLADMRSAFGERPGVRVDSDAEYVGVGEAGQPPVGWPGDDEMIVRYLSDKLDERTKPLAAALEKRSVTGTPVVVESENAATTILSETGARKADVVVVGSHGQGLFEGLLRSTRTKVMRLASCPVLVLRSPAP